MAKKATFMRAAAEAYAIENEIVKKPGKLKDKELIEKMDTWWKKFAKKYAKEDSDGEDPDVCDEKDGGCGRFIADDDTFCWYCGTDVTTDGKGGFKPDDEEEEKEKESEEEEEESEEEEAEEESEESEKEESEEESKEEGDEVSLKDRVEKICKLSRRSGGDAWEIGRELALIVSGKQYKDEKFKTFEDFSKKTLGMERGSAYSYIRIAEVFSQEDASLIPIFKLNLLASIKDEKARNKLIKAAKPKGEGGKDLDIKALKEKIKAEKEKNPSDRASSSGRPSVSPLKKLVGQKFKSNWGTGDNGDDEMILADADAFGGGGVGIYIKKLKKGLKCEIVDLEPDGEEGGEEGEEE